MTKQTYAQIQQWYVAFEEMLKENPQFEAVGRHFNSSVDDKADISKLHAIHYNLRANQYLNPAFITNFTTCVDAFQRHVMGLPMVATSTASFIAPVLAHLNDKGYARLPPLPAQIHKEMYDYLEGQPVRQAPNDRQSVEYVERNEIREKEHVGKLSEHAVTNCPHFLEYILSPEILQIVERRIGATPTLVSLDSWWSFADCQAPREAQNFHIDVDDYRFVKIFIYLTDVDKDAGPHTYIPGTQDRTFMTQLIERNQEKYPEMRNWYFAQLRKSDAEVAQYIGVEPDYLEGPAGSCMIVDTSGIHKGLLPNNKDRLLLQATFGCTPCKTTMLDPLQMGSISTNNIKPDILTPPNDYIARLFVSN